MADTDEGAVPVLLPLVAVPVLEDLLARHLVAAYRTSGGRPAPAAQRALAVLHEAAQGRRFAPEPAFATPATVDQGVRNVFTAAEAADVLGCTPKHVRHLCRGGHFPSAYRVADTGPWLIPSADLHAFRTGRWREARGIPGPAPAERAGDDDTGPAADRC
ncbi:helix-turn-helix domain-containing protein [Streptomyces coelicoflavus]|uniref:helix-turn-helix domain-containing protein n=1 Tax=Streptomyces coelicoflavus TaxID=285562 RepID=UPI003864A0AF